MHKAAPNPLSNEVVSEAFRHQLVYVQLTNFFERGWSRFHYGSFDSVLTAKKITDGNIQHFQKSFEEMDQDLTSMIVAMPSCIDLNHPKCSDIHKAFLELKRMSLKNSGAYLGNLQSSASPF